MEMMRGSDVAGPADIENPSLSKKIIKNPLETLKMDLGKLSPMSPRRCIYRVPDRFRRVRKKDYTPHVISIGPFHHGKEALKPMEVHKRWYLKCFMEQTHLNLNDYIGKIKEKEKELRNRYGETIMLSSDQFVRMILVDAIFLIEFLRRYKHYVLRGVEYEPTDEHDCIFGKPMMVDDVQTDLLMLENQLPLFILEDLFCLHNPHLRGEAKMLSINFVINHDTLCIKEKPYNDYQSQVEGEHFVDLLRDLSMRNPLLKNRPNKRGVRELKFATIPNIEKLHLTGVKIQGEPIPNLFDLSFEKCCMKMNGVLKIPKLRVDDTTELILRNLIAFEQCSFCEDPIITHYVILMDMLVNTPKDVELLVDRGIVENNLSSDNYELSSMINRLSREIAWDPCNFYYAALCNDLQNFCSKNWHKFWANLSRKYFNFNTPWTTISVVAAIVLLILTFIQTICAIYPLDLGLDYV